MQLLPSMDLRMPPIQMRCVTGAGTARTSALASMIAASFATSASATRLSIATRSSVLRACSLRLAALARRAISLTGDMGGVVCCYGAPVWGLKESVSRGVAQEGCSGP
jgi:hypothetical protein